MLKLISYLKNFIQKFSELDGFICSSMCALSGNRNVNDDTFFQNQSLYGTVIKILSDVYSYCVD